MEIIRGTNVFSGITIGKIKYIYNSEEEQKLDISSELSLLHVAEDQLFRDFLMLTVMEEEEIEELTLLKSSAFQKALDEMIVQERIHATQALVVTTEEMIRSFGGLESECIRRKIRAMGQISNKLQGILEKMNREKSILDEPVIVVTESLTPNQMMRLEKKNILAMVTGTGSESAHTAIVAKEMDIPVIIDVDIDEGWDGESAIVDGYSGIIYVDPDKKTLE